MRRLSLRTQVAIAMVAVSLSTTAVSTVLLAGELRSLLVEGAEQDLRSAAQNAEVELTGRLVQLRQDVTFLAELPDALEPGWGTLPSTFAALAHSRPAYDQVRLIEVGPDGMELVRVDRHTPDGSVRVVPPEDLQAKGSRDYVVSGAASEGPWISEIQLNREHGEVQSPHNPVVRAVQAVQDAEGRAVAVVVINLRMDPVFAEIEARVPDDLDLVVTNERGQLLFGPGQPFGFDLGDAQTVLATYPSLASRLTLAETSANPALLQEARRGGLPQRPVGIVVTQPRQVVDRLAGSAVRRSVSVALVAALVLAVLATLLLADTISRPFRLLAEQIRKADTEGSLGYLKTDQPEALVVANAFKHAWQRASRALAELRDAERSLRLSNAQLQQFAYVISHDMRAPLRGIRACISWIREDLPHPSAEVSENLGFIESRAERLGTMIEGVLAFAKVSGTVPAVASPVAVEPILDEVIRDLGEHDATIGREPLPPVWATEDEVHRVLQNLLANAIRHAGPEARVEVAPLMEGTACVGFSVADRGPGVPDAVKEEIFDLLRKGPGAGEQGAGIGLAIASQLVERRGGTLEVADREGGGAIFRVCLPDLSAETPQGPVTPL